MNPHPPTAADRLIAETTGIRPEVIAQAQQASELLRRLGLLSTEPTEAISPFARRPVEAPKPAATAPTRIRFAQVG